RDRTPRARAPARAGPAVSRARRRRRSTPASRPRATARGGARAPGWDGTARPTPPGNRAASAPPRRPLPRTPSRRRRSSARGSRLALLDPHGLDPYLRPRHPEALRDLRRQPLHDAPGEALGRRIALQELRQRSRVPLQRFPLAIPLKPEAGDRPRASG